MPRVPLWILLVLASPAVHAAECRFDDAHARFAALVASEGLPGGGMLVGTTQGVLAERYLGSYTPQTVIALASASKLASAVRIAQVIERGEAGLDTPVSTYLPAFTGEKGTMTLRRMFSHTAGYGGDESAPVLGDDTITLAEAVQRIACCRPFEAGYTMGGQFAYGGISMHVAGRVAEVVGGGDWEQRWRSEVGTPLGITTIDWQGLGPTANYRISGSGQSSLPDYGRLLHMLANRGRGDGVRVLKPASVRLIVEDQVGDRPIAYAPNNAVAPIRYGLGNWIAPGPQGEPTFSHSLGAFGFFPWFDTSRGLYGAFMIRGGAGINDQAFPVYLQMVADITARFDAGGCTPITPTDEVFVETFDAG